MLTDIFNETTYMLYVGDHSRDILELAFKNHEISDDFGVLKSIVSRKKQVMPSLINAVEEFRGRVKINKLF